MGFRDEFRLRADLSALEGNEMVRPCVATGKLSERTQNGLFGLGDGLIGERLAGRGLMGSNRGQVGNDPPLARICAHAPAAVVILLFISLLTLSH